MSAQPLALDHPVEELELDPNDLDPVKWDHWNPPTLFLMESKIPSNYMPPLGMVTVEGKGRCEQAANNEVIATFWLNRPVNWLWRLFFEGHRGDWNVTFEGNLLTIRVLAASARDAYEHVVYHAIPKTCVDYANERSRLVWLAYVRLEKRARCEGVQ